MTKISDGMLKNINNFPVRYATRYHIIIMINLAYITSLIRFVSYKTKLSVKNARSCTVYNNNDMVMLD